MMIDLASLLSGLTVQPGAVANVVAGAGLPNIAGTDAGIVASQTAAGRATPFQTALAAQVKAQILPPVGQVSPVPSVGLIQIPVGLTTLRAATKAPVLKPHAAPAPALPQLHAVTARSSDAMVLAVAPVPPTPASLEQIVVLVSPEAAPARTIVAAAPVPVPVPLMGGAAAPLVAAPLATTRLTTLPVVATTADPIAVASEQPPTAAGNKNANGKLPVIGHMLPVGAPAKPSVTTRLSVAGPHDDGSDQPTDEKTAIPVATADPTIPAPQLLVAASMQPLTPNTPAISPAPPASAAPVPAPTHQSIAPPASTAMIAQPLPSATAPTATESKAVAVAAASPVAIPAVPRLQVADGSTSAAPAITISAIQVPALAAALQHSPTDPAAASKPLTPQPAVMAVTAPIVIVPAPAVAAIANVAPVMAAGTSLPARQSSVPRAADGKIAKVSAGSPTPSAGDNAAALTPAGNPPIAPTATAPVITVPASTPAPQDFAALVDRLVEARAAAQTSIAPQQISAAVNHADFGKVSLTFNQDKAGLSVRMTSADPGFAHAAQSAIADVPELAIAGPASAMAGPALAMAGPATVSQPGTTTAQSGSFSQSSAPPGGPGQASPGASGHSAAGSPAGGGSAQSQAQSQPQARAAIIAAANRSAPAATATTRGIFA